MTAAVTLPPTNPGTPVMPATDQHSAGWNVTWAPSTLNSGSSGAVSYELDQSFNGGGYSAVGGTPTNNSGTMYMVATAVSSGGYYQSGTYTYRVHACTSDPLTGGTACTGYQTGSGYATTIAPGTPASLSVPSSSNGDGSFTVTYGAPASNSGGEVTGYEVQLGDVSCESAQNCTTYWVDGNCTSTTLSCTFPAAQVAPGTFVTRVEAFDNTVAGGFLTTGGITVSYTIPAAPGGVTITPSTSSTGAYTLSWNASSGATSYQIYSSGGTYVNTVSGSPPATSAGFSEPDGTYAYYIEACNRGGCSAPSATASVTVSIPPGAMGAISASPNPSYNGNYTLSWSAPSGNVTAYDVYMSKNGAAYGFIGSTASLSYTVMDMVAGSYAYYVVACYNSSCSAASPTVTVTVAAPAVPTGVGVSPNPSTNGSFTLSWTAVSGAGDYVVFTSSGGYVQSVATNSLSFSGFSNGTYGYYVIACDNTACSGASSEVNETVLLPPGEPSSISLNPTSVEAGSSYTLSWGSASGSVGYYLVNGATQYSASTYSVTYTTGFRANGTRSYYVQACNSSGCGPATATVTETITPISSCPPAPKQCQVMGAPGTRAPSAGTGAVPPPSEAAQSTRLLTRAAPLPGIPQSTRQAFFLAHAGRQNQSTKPLVPESDERIAGVSVVRAGSGGLHRDSGFSHSKEPLNNSISVIPAEAGIQSFQEPGHLPAKAGITPVRRINQSFPNSELVAQTLVVPLHETADHKNTLSPAGERARREVPSGLPRMAALGFGMQQESAIPKGAMGNSQSSPHLAHAAWHYAPAVNPQLSEYPPLRHDPRVEAHFESLGGRLPGVARPADCGGSDSDNDCSQPTGGTALMVGYVYNSVGYLREVDKLNSSGTVVRVLWEAADETASGQVDQEGFDAASYSSTLSGASFSINSTYDTASGLLDSTTATASVATVSASYTWDGYNNLCSRTLSESGQSATLNEGFGYDALNRLTDISTGTGQCSSGSTIVYNAVGGFQANGGYSGYQYDPGHPHELTSLTTAAGATRSFTYDADGNLLTESGDVNRSVTWASYNKPAQIIGNGVTETFTYGPDRSRLVTAITQGSDTVTTTYIDGLFEQVYDSATGNLTYRHYILAGGARVGVETIEANSGGTVTSDALSFYVRDEVGSVIATVTENLGGVNQSLSLASYGAWGKARATSGTSAYQDPAPGTFYSPTPAGQEEGFAGHDNLEDTGLVDMEGRVYDPEVGEFLSPDPNVQYPFSSQGYERYIYVNDNPLSLSDPSGYFTGNQWLGLAAAVVVTWACEGTCTAYTTAFLAGATDGYLSSGGNLQQTALSGLEAMTFTYVGDEVNWGTSMGDLLEKSVAEGVVGGAFSEAGGGNFGDGFLGAFSSSELSPVIGSIGGSTASPAYYSAGNMAARVAASAVVGGTVAAMTGGSFTDGAVAAAFQRLFNEEQAAVNIRGTPSTDAEAEKLLDAHDLATDKETLFVVMQNGSIVSGSNCTSDYCSVTLDGSAKVSFVAHTHIASTSPDPGTNWVETEMRELPGPQDTEPLTVWGAPNYFRTPSGAIRVLERIDGIYEVRTVQGSNFIYQSLYRPGNNSLIIQMLVQRYDRGNQ